VLECPSLSCPTAGPVASFRCARPKTRDFYKPFKVKEFNFVNTHTNGRGARS